MRHLFEVHYLAQTFGRGERVPELVFGHGKGDVLRSVAPDRLQDNIDVDLRLREAVEELERRLVKRGTDSAEMIAKRVAKASFELTFASKFDVVIVNDDLEEAQEKALSTIKSFLQI